MLVGRGRDGWPSGRAEVQSYQLRREVSTQLGLEGRRDGRSCSGGRTRDVQSLELSTERVTSCERTRSRERATACERACALLEWVKFFVVFTEVHESIVLLILLTEGWRVGAGGRSLGSGRGGKWRGS